MQEFDDFAIQLILTIFLLLAGVFTALIIYTIYNRYQKARQEEVLEAASIYVQPLIYSYLEGELSRKQFSDQLRDIYDKIASYRYLNVMIDNMSGEEKEKLKDLLNLYKYKSYFLGKLSTRQPVDLAQACMYFAQKDEADFDAIEKIKPLQHHDYTVVAYAATLALINSPHQDVRDEALGIFLHRKKNASMSVTDIVFKYVEGHKDREKASQNLMKYVANPYVPVGTAVSVIKMFPELGFFNLQEALYKEFTNPARTDYSGRYSSVLIDVLKEFSHPGLGEHIKKQRLWASVFQKVRYSVILWIQQYYESEWDDIILKLAQDSDLEIRIAAQSTLLLSKNVEKLSAKIPEGYQKEWEEVKATGGTRVVII